MDEEMVGPAILPGFGDGSEHRMQEDMEFKLKRDIESESKFDYPPMDDGDDPDTPTRKDGVPGIPAFVRSKRINGLARKYCSGVIPVGHRVSDLVIREYAGENYLAAFLTCFDSKSNEHHKLYRPYMWLLMDFTTGDIIRILETSDDEFCPDASYDTPLNPLPDGTYDLSYEHFRYIYSILDEVRIQYLKGEGFDKERYQEYLEEIKGTTPKDFHIFFDSLSRPKAQ